MKKILIGLIFLIIIIFAMSGIFFLIDKAEYYSNGKTLFTIDEDLGDGLTRKIGLGYIMYTKNTGFPTNENDNLITSWFNAIKRNEAIEILSVDNTNTLIDNLNSEDSQVVKYYSYLIMSSLNSESDKFKIEDTGAIFINLSELENLKTKEKISQQIIDSIKNILNEKLNNSNIKIEDIFIEETDRDKKIQNVLVQGFMDGIYINIHTLDVENKVEVEIIKREVELFKVTTKEKVSVVYKYNIDLIDNSIDGNIFTMEISIP